MREVTGSLPAFSTKWRVDGTRSNGETWPKERWPARLVRPLNPEINNTECKFIACVIH